MLNALGFGWDEQNKMVLAIEDVWDGYIVTHPYAERVRGKHIERWDDLAFMFGNDCAHGEFASMTYSSPISGKRRGRDEFKSNDDSNEGASQTVHLSSSDDDDRGPPPRVRGRDGSLSNRAKRANKSPMEATSGSRHSLIEGSEISRGRRHRSSEHISEKMGEVAEAVNNLIITLGQGKSMTHVQRLLGILEEVDGLSHEDQLRVVRFLQTHVVSAGYFIKMDHERRKE
ncbi:uncharacterized protein At2g29880-like [Magnolia sinica]|uniref:uncharacterized protein At2g29880-like n=1 Tax=Magnolia sinica TaxID=86752 RepID=UPI0026591085|nr:uncharacterized protein At2g29880-like [Magnolia sinica]